MDCIKHEALKEPLVDVVTGDAVITSQFPVLVLIYLFFDYLIYGHLDIKFKNG